MNRRPRIAAALATLAVAATSLTGCLEHPIKEVQLDSTVVGEDTVDVTPRREVDILFVIDNSGSMGEEQAILSANFERFVDKLDVAGANYRLAVTTTDVGNGIYCNDSTPEDGAFVLSTCHDRAQSFTNDALELDKFVEACETHCPADFAGAGTVPSQTALTGDELAARPWIEHFGNGVTNLADMTPAQAFQCFGPQGIDGCGYNESPLQAMYRALERSQDPNDPAYGFVREDALLAVVFITDENDCSVADHAIDIFHPNGDRAFWEDKTLGGPTSAVCWNAGVSADCFENGNCVSQDYAADGTPTDDPSEAALTSLAQYKDALRLLKGKDEQGDIFVSLIAGVPEAYPDQAIPYSPADNEIDQLNFGVGFGCESEDGGKAVPPVRMKEFADEFAKGETTNIFSICADDYSPALTALADGLIAEIVPACMPACVADIDPETEGMQVECTVTEIIGETDRINLPTCERDGDGWATPAEGACFFVKTDDQLSEACAEAGQNLEFEVLRADGEVAPSGSRIAAECQLSDKQETDCPDLST